MDRFDELLKNIKESKKEIKILPVSEKVKEGLNDKYRINQDSMLGTILFNSGGIIIENWIRIYGCGDINFCERNNLFPYSDIVVAEDILGGLFVILNNGKISYFAPDCLEWEHMELSYSEFISWAFHGNTDLYYKDYRWNTWKKELKNIRNENGISFYPFLWAEADSLESRSRKEIPMSEIIKF